MSSVLARAGWIYTFLASRLPAIRIMLGWTLLGPIADLIWARVNHMWPVAPKQIIEEVLEIQDA